MNMKNGNEEIKRKIEMMECREHEKHPEVEMTPDGLSIRACCADFRSEVIEKYRELKADQVRDSILSRFWK